MKWTLQQGASFMHTHNIIADSQRSATTITTKKKICNPNLFMWEFQLWINKIFEIRRLWDFFSPIHLFYQAKESEAKSLSEYNKI